MVEMRTAMLLATLIFNLMAQQVTLIMGNRTAMVLVALVINLTSHQLRLIRWKRRPTVAIAEVTARAKRNVVAVADSVDVMRIMMGIVMRTMRMVVVL